MLTCCIKALYLLTYQIYSIHFTFWNNGSYKGKEGFNYVQDYFNADVENYVFKGIGKHILRLKAKKHFFFEE